MFDKVFLVICVVQDYKWLILRWFLDYFIFKSVLVICCIYYYVYSFEYDVYVRGKVKIVQIVVIEICVFDKRVFVVVGNLLRVSDVWM